MKHPIRHSPVACIAAGLPISRISLALFALLMTAISGGTCAAGEDQAHDAGEGKSAAASERAGEREYARRGGARWGKNYFPNPTLTTHEGESVRFFDDLVKDKVVAINMVYASCPDSCPLATAQLAKVQRVLGDRVGRDIHMYSISIDPENDTPEKLKSYAEKFKVGPGWKFLTGNADDIMLLRKKLGFLIDGIDTGIRDHNGVVLIGNQRTGQWMKRSPMDSPHILAAQIGNWLSSWRGAPPLETANYAEAPELRTPTMGENLFRTRCAACHTIGGQSRLVGAGAQIDEDHQLGPDLLGVTAKRSRDWLVRWLKNPSKLVEEEDPIALALYAEYDGLTMPNFRLGDVEVNALLEYMQEESDRVRKSAVASRSERSRKHDAHHH
ncbi:MAG: SCO family protein [Wenzhouxiangellaceae bacterium]